jgi:hypothetical protein
MRSLTAAERETMVRPTVCVVVQFGFVWERDVDAATGEPVGALRPHYREGARGYPAGGYPDLAAAAKT